MLCSLRQRNGRLANKLSKNCTAVVTTIGRSQQGAAFLRHPSPRHRRLDASVRRRMRCDARGQRLGFRALRGRRPPFAPRSMSVPLHPRSTGARLASPNQRSVSRKSASTRAENSICTKNAQPNGSCRWPTAVAAAREAPAKRFDRTKAQACVRNVSAHRAGVSANGTPVRLPRMMTGNDEPQMRPMGAPKGRGQRVA
jgi:hypothetical protein